MVFHLKKSIIMKRHKPIGKSQSGQIDFELLNNYWILPINWLMGLGDVYFYSKI